MNLFCARPWYWLELSSTGYHLCCPPWIRTPIGQVPDDPLEAWNNEKAKEVRRSILDQSFKFCGNCPFLKRGRFEGGYICDIMGPPETIDDPFLQRVIKEQIVEVERPEQLHLSYDRSCNLRCPMCRPHAIHIGSGPEYEKLRRFQDVLTQGILRVVPNVTITGSGDPFGSRHYHELLKSMKAEDYPQLRLTLLTNGQLVDQKHWGSISGINSRVKEIMLSIDAACEETYKINRPPGDWNTMLKNLEFMSELRTSGKLEQFVSIFIVQNTNWREMEDYVRLAKRFNIDEVRFKPVLNFGHYSESQLANASVHFREHPDHDEFVKMLNESDILSQSWVKKGAGLANLLWKPML